MKVLTSMNERIFAEYGREMIERFLRFWPPRVELVIYYDGKRPLWDQPHDRRRVHWRWLEAISGFVDFRNYAEARQARMPTPKINGFLMKAWPFACKGFAWGDYLPDDDVIWLDADVHTFDHIPPDFLDGLIGPEPYTYLGRNTYTETGFIAFKNDPRSYLLRRRALEMYRSKAVFDLQYWTDCQVFDAARADIPGRNLTPHGKGVDHVFNQSLLGAYLDHMKGPNRKRHGFSPDFHASTEQRDSVVG